MEMPVPPAYPVVGEYSETVAPLPPTISPVPTIFRCVGFSPGFVPVMRIAAPDNAEVVPSSPRTEKPFRSSVTRPRLSGSTADATFRVRVTRSSPVPASRSYVAPGKARRTA